MAKPFMRVRLDQPKAPKMTPKGAAKPAPKPMPLVKPRAKVAAAANAAIDRAKRALGQRGPVWWSDGAPDFNRHMAVNTPYKPWYDALAEHGPV